MIGIAVPASPDSPDSAAAIPLDHLFDLGTDPMAVASLDGVILRANRAFGAVLDVEPRVLIGRSLMEFIHPDERRATLRGIVRLGRGDTVIGLEMRLRTGSGYRRLEWNAQSVGRLIYGVGRDVTERAEREAELRFREHQLSEAQRLARLGDWRWRYGTDRLIWSDQVYRIFGIEPGTERPTRRLLFQRLHPDDRGRLQAAMERSLAERTSYDAECRVQLPSGEERFVWIEIHCDVDEADRLQGLYGVCQDVTGQKLVEQALREAKHAAEAASRAKSQFLATMSHELRTPLNAILGFSELMLAGLAGPLAARYRDYAQAIHASGQHLLDLINDVLDMSKIEAGKYVLNIEPVDLAAVIRDCLRLVGGRADEAGISIGYHPVDPPPVIGADARALRQILLNLQSNAIKFTRRNGRIVIATRQLGDEVEISVEDNGVGIPAAKLPAVTQPFEVADAGYDHPDQGTGLGLAITKSLVQLHGGSLDIRSELGVGTRVTVRLPISASPPDALA